MSGKPVELAARSKLFTHVTSDPRRASAWSAAVVEVIFAIESTLASRDEVW